MTTREKILILSFIAAFSVLTLAGRIVLAEETTEIIQAPVLAPDSAPAPIITPEPTPTIEPAPAPEPVQEPAAVEIVPVPIEETTTSTESAGTDATIEVQPAPEQEQPMIIAPQNAPQEEPQISVDTGIVFEDASSTSELIFQGFFDAKQIENGEKDRAFWQIFYHAVDGSEIQITDSGYDNLQYQVNSSKVVWKAYSTPQQGHAEIFLYDAEIRDKKQISINNSSNDDPVLTDDGQVVWRGWDTELGTWNIYFYNGMETTRISNTNEGALWPSIAGDVITWQEKSGGVWQIMAYNISTHRPWLITGDSRNNEHPQTDGRNIVWQKEIAEGAHDIFVYDLKTERLWQVSKGPGDKVLPRLTKDKKIAWFHKKTELDNPDFEEVNWDTADIAELTATKPKAIQEGAAAIAPVGVSLDDSSGGSDENNIVPMEADTSSTSPPVLEPVIATTTPETAAQESAPIDIQGAIDEITSPTATVSLTEPASEPASEISLPPAPESTESATIPIQ